MTDLAKKLRAALTKVEQAKSYNDATRAIDLLAQLVVKNGNEILAALEREPDEAMVERVRQDRKPPAELHSAAVAIWDDLLDRATLKPDGTKVVNASNERWQRFCAAIAAMKGTSDD